MAERVVITGMGCITPLGNNLTLFIDSLQQGKSGARPITRFDASDHACRIACEVIGFDLKSRVPADWFKDLKRADLATQYAAVAAIEALGQSGRTLEQRVPELEAGVILGTGIGGIGSFEEQVVRLKERGPGRVSSFTIPQLMPNAGAGQIAQMFKLHGPAYALSTACSSANDAMGLAFLLITSGQYNYIVTGGTEAGITPTSVAAFGNMGALTTKYNDRPQQASRPFDRDRSGFVMGEGAGILVFESLEYARRRGANIYAEVVGFGVTDDAGDMVAPDPTGTYAALAMTKALRQGCLVPGEVDYINAHGTSTLLNDAGETQAIKIALGDRAHRIPTSSTKSMHGHALGAAGGLELIATIGAMSLGFIPPTINLDNSDPHCDLDYVPNVARNGRINVALSNSFGFGGHNSCIAVRSYTE